jgi:MFS family permease
LPLGVVAVLSSNLSAMIAAERARLTFRRDCWRMLAVGVLESAGHTFLLLIAVVHFQAGAIAKALIAGGGSVGLLCSPLAVSLVTRWRWPATKGASRLLWIGSGTCLIAAAVKRLEIFVPACVLAMTVGSAIVPLMTQVYQDNYPPEERGKLYARTFSLRIVGAMLFAWLGGMFLDWRPDWVPVLLAVFAGAFALAAVAVGGILSRPLHDAGGAHPLHAFKYVRTDRVFRHTLIVWMFMGFANLMMLPIRVEYLGNPQHGLALSAASIGLLTGVIPNLARLIMNPVWGWLFDRMNFFGLRFTLNMGFALGIAAFFTSDSWPGLILGAVIYGISNAGGDVAWGLWVTKIAAPERVADYMSVHTFLTGIRGVLAPLIGFQLLQHFAPAALGWFSATLIVVATLLLIPEIRRTVKLRRGQLLTEEVTD